MAKKNLNIGMAINRHCDRQNKHIFDQKEIPWAGRHFLAVYLTDLVFVNFQRIGHPDLGNLGIGQSYTLLLFHLVGHWLLIGQ